MRRTGRRGARNQSGRTAAQKLASAEAFLAQNFFAWMRPDSNVNSSGTVSKYLDRVNPGVGARAIDPTHGWSQATAANQTAVPAKDALANNRESAVFSTSAVSYSSTLTAANWGFLHKGTGGKAWAVGYNPNQSGIFSFFCTGSLLSAGAGIGASMFRQAATVRTLVSNGTSWYADSGQVGSAPINALDVLSSEYNSSNANKLVLRQNGANAYAGNPATDAPSASNPANTCIIGACPGSTGAGDVIVDLLFFAGATTPLVESMVSSYIKLRYGVSA